MAIQIGDAHLANPGDIDQFTRKLGEEVADRFIAEGERPIER